MSALARRRTEKPMCWGGAEKAAESPPYSLSVHRFRVTRSLDKQRLTSDRLMPNAKAQFVGSGCPGAVKSTLRWMVWNPSWPPYGSQLGSLTGRITWQLLFIAAIFKHLWWKHKHLLASFTKREGYEWSHHFLFFPFQSSKCIKGCSCLIKSSIQV